MGNGTVERLELQRELRPAASPEVAHSDDFDLVQRVLAGERPAREQLATRLGCVGPILRSRHRALNGRLGEDDLLDVAQEVVARVLAKLPTYQGAARLEVWVYSFCESELLRALARRRRQAQRNAELDQVSEDLAIEVELGSEPDLALWSCVGRLPSADQAIVQARHDADLPFQDIAARLGQSVSFTKTRYYRALVQLRACLDRSRGRRSA